MSKKEIQEELDYLNSSLKTSREKSTYDPPDGYFKHMQEAVLNKLKDDHKTINLTRESGFIKRRTFFSFAAVFLLLVVAYFVFFQNTVNKTGFEDLENASIFSYLNENMEDMDENLLIDLEESYTYTNTLLPELEEAEFYLEEYLEDFSVEDLENIL